MITFRKSTKKNISATADVENVALLAECAQNNCGRRLLSAVPDGNLCLQRNKRSSAGILISPVIFPDALLVSPKLQTSDILSRYLV